MAHFFTLVAIVYAPSATRAAGLSEDFAPMFVRELVHDRMPFEACIAFALAIKSLNNDIDSRVSQTILEYSAKGLSSLRKRILSGLDATSDMVIWTILALCTVSVCAEYPNAPYTTELCYSSWQMTLRQ
jgi:hypothetical protein